MKRVFLLLSLLAPSAFAALPQPAGFEFSAGVKFTVAGYAGSAPLSGFPVLVRISDGSPSGFFYDDLQSKSTGADLAFVDMDGNGLPFEIDTWNPAGESLVWVRLPVLTNGTSFVMCWGSETSGKTVCGTNPFAAYKGVWHMNASSPADASGSGNAGTAAGGATVATGKIGSALSLPTTSDYVTCGQHQSNAELKDGFTVEAWVNAASYSGNRCIFGKTDFVSIRTGSQTSFQVTTPGKKDHNMTVPALPATGSWWHMAVTFQKSTSNGCKVYVNGSLAAQMTADGINNQTDATEMWFGKNQWGQNFTGLLDEMRLSADIKSADWIAATCAAQNDAAFLTAGAAEVWREKPAPAAELSVGSVQVSNAVATVSVSRLGRDASYVDVTVTVSASEDFSSTAWTETGRFTGEGSRNFAVTGLDPFTAYYARAVAVNDRGESATTAVVPFRTKRAPRAPGVKIVEGLEIYGALTLVDEIDCSLPLADDPDHLFRDYPAGASYVTNILGVDTRVLHHRDDTGAYVSWRVGKGKGIVPNEPYVLVVDYPDEAPRSVTLMNFGNGTRHGYHTGFTVGDSMSPPYVTQSLESWAIPFSGEWKQVVEVMVPYKKATQYNGGSRIDVATEGFDVDFALILQKEAKDSVGFAASSIRLYKIDSYDVARPAYPYPAEGLPRRLVTSREEMGDNDNHAAYSDDPTEFYKGRAKMIRLLGMNGCSKDLLEFGYMQNWDTFGRGWRWGTAADYWTKAVEYLGQEDIDILPFYEYHGSRGSGGIGYNKDLMPWTLESAKYSDRKYHFSNQLNYVSNCMADLTNDETLWDLEELFRLTVLNLSDKARFRGMWLRNRGGMPMGFNDNALARFNRETGRTAAGTEVTRADIYNNGNYRGTALYEEYRTWWYEKRRDLFAALRAYMASNLEGAVLYYSNTLEEPGEFWANWGNPHPALLSNEEGYTYQGKNFNEYTGKNWSTSIGAAAGQYWPNALHADPPTWDPYEINHSAPADDPHDYTNLTGVALCYPFNTVWTVADKTAAARYRNKSGDLPFVRHYSLNEHDLRDGPNPPNGNAICGYYTCDWDHAGRAVMLAELYAMAYDDPTMLGYLFGSNLARTDSVYVREFNLNFLSLPAMKGETLVGGGWSSTFTVRRWVTDKGVYWAAINCDSKPWNGTVDFRTDKAEIWRTVSGEALPLSGGKAALALEPFQMVCFKDVEPERVETPVFRYAYAKDVEAKSATVVANLSDLGYGSTWADATWSVAGVAGASGSFPRFSSHGEQSVRVTGLEPETEYTVDLVATGSTGKTATMSFTFKTAIWPYVFQTPTAVTDAEGTTATASVKLTRTDRDGALELRVGGETVERWNAVVAGQLYSASFPVKPGRYADYVFVVEPDGTYETEAPGRVLGRQTIGWLDVQLDKSGYSAWPFASAGGVDPVDGGTWTLSGANNISKRSTDGGNVRIDLATEADGFVRYQAREPSADGRKVRVEGRTQLAAEYGVPDALSPAPLAALALGKEGTVQTLYGYAASGWVPFSGYRVPADGWIDWTADIDFDAGTVTYGAGDPPVALASAAGTALPVADAAKKRVARVTYVGSGAIDDFRGVYYVETNAAPAILPFEARIVPGSAGLSFSNAGTDTENFSILLDGVADGDWFVAFGSDDLTVPVTNWTCVACARASGGTARLDADTVDDETGEAIPSQFFVVYGASEPVDKGVPLSKLLEE